MPQLYTQHDNDLCDFVLLVLKSGPIDFQFPPRLTSDNRRGTWSEGELRGTEPVAVFSTSGPREMSLTWTYIVDGGQWTVDKISANIRRIRGYFAEVRKAGTTRNLVVMFKIWKIGGPDPMSCRISSVDVKYGDTLVGQGDDAFPLRTDITIDLKIWTKGGADEKVQDLRTLRDDLPPEWY